MENQRYAAYKDMLLSVADIIDQDISVLESMKFKCDRLIKAREREKIKSTIQLWTALEKREYLGLSNTHFLKELLKSCMRGQLEALRIVENYEHLNIPGSVNQHQRPTQIECTEKPHIVYILDGHKGSFTKCQQERKVHGPDLKAETAFLTKALGRNWTFFMRELGVPESDIEAIKYDYRYTKEHIHQCLLLWQNTQKEAATKERLINALKATNRNDLSDTLERGTY